MSAYQPSMFYTGPALSSTCDTWGTPQEHVWLSPKVPDPARLFTELEA